MNSRATVWSTLLGVVREEERQLDIEIRQIKQTLPNQHVIRVDIPRTRADIELFTREKVRAVMASVLTFYCRSTDTRYRQGMNEILAPFVYLDRARLSEAHIFKMYAAFIHKFAKYMFCDDDFTALQSMLALFGLLLRFHDPKLASHLNRHSLPPQLYMTPNVLTLHALGCPLQQLLLLWDHYLSDGDPFLHIFVSLAWITSFSKELLATRHRLPDIAALIKKRWKRIDASTVTRLIEKARELRGATPRSFMCSLESKLFGAKQPPSHVHDALQRLSAPTITASNLVKLLVRKRHIRESFSSHANARTHKTSENRSAPLQPFKSIASEIMPDVVMLDCRSTIQFFRCHVQDALHLDTKVVAHIRALTRTPGSKSASKVDYAGISKTVQTLWHQTNAPALGLQDGTNGLKLVCLIGSDNSVSVFDGDDDSRDPTTCTYADLEALIVFFQAQNIPRICILTGGFLSLRHALERLGTQLLEYNRNKTVAKMQRAVNKMKNSVSSTFSGFKSSISSYASQWSAKPSMQSQSALMPTLAIEKQAIDFLLDQDRHLDITHQCNGSLRHLQRCIQSGALKLPPQGAYVQSLRHSAAQGHAVYFHVSSIQPVLISKRILVDQPKLHHTIKPDDAVTGTGNSQNIRTARMPSKQAKRALPSTVLSQKCPPGTALTECPPCSGGDPPDVPNTAPAHLLGAKNKSKIDNEKKTLLVDAVQLQTPISKMRPVRLGKLFKRLRVQHKWMCRRFQSTSKKVLPTECVVAVNNSVFIVLEFADQQRTNGSAPDPKRYANVISVDMLSRLRKITPSKKFPRVVILRFSRDDADANVVWE